MLGHSEILMRAAMNQTCWFVLPISPPMRVRWALSSHISMITIYFRLRASSMETTVRLTPASASLTAWRPTTSSSLGCFNATWRLSSNQSTTKTWWDMFFEMGQSRPLFAYFSFFFTMHTNIAQILTINYNSIGGLLGTRIRSDRMEGSDESTELCMAEMLPV